MDSSVILVNPIPGQILTLLLGECTMDFVQVDKFWMGKYPVTKQQYDQLVQASRKPGATFIIQSQPNDWTAGTAPTREENHPVVWVAKNQAELFCRWASSVSGDYIYLPSEKEWEKAALGTDGRINPWGNQNPDTNLCNFGENENETTPVGKYSPQGDSPYGCADMVGNVWEWVSDEPPKQPGQYLSVAGDSPRYFIARGGSWRSNKSGLSGRSSYHFNSCNANDNNLGFRCCLETHFNSLVLDPLTPTTMYLGGRGGVYKSTDGGCVINSAGRNWNASRININPRTSDKVIYRYQLEDRIVISLAIDPQNPTVLYAGTREGVFKSTDGSRNWNSINIGLPDDTSVVTALAIDPQVPATLFATINNAIFQSKDSGENWYLVNKLMASASAVETLAIDPQTPTIMYAGTENGLFTSIDSGVNWNCINQALAGKFKVTTLVVDHQISTTLYAGTNTGIIISKDSGRNWFYVDKSMSKVSVSALAISQQTPKILYAVTYHSGVFSFEISRS